MDDPSFPATRLYRILQQRLESLQRSGVTHLPRRTEVRDSSPAGLLPPHTPKLAPNSGPTPKVANLAPPTATTAKVSVVPPPSIPTAPSAASVTETQSPPAPLDRVAALRVLQEEVVACTLCTELAKTRTQTVFGVGNPDARVVFMGEAPGFDEDRQGEPFVGAAGQLLTKIIESGMGLSRSQVYILNTLKCRPPKNRTPTADEVANCRGFFEQQLDILRPEYIVCLGAVAAQNLLETKQSIGRLRGRFHEYRGIKVLVTYHPAYLLRTPEDKRKTWEDIKLLMRDMGLPVKGE